MGLNATEIVSVGPGPYPVRYGDRDPLPARRWRIYVEDHMDRIVRVEIVGAFPPVDAQRGGTVPMELQLDDEQEGRLRSVAVFPAVTLERVDLPGRGQPSISTLLAVPVDGVAFSVISYDVELASPPSGRIIAIGQPEKEERP